eukprot:6307139-Alexandrium_andersonii.AAC.1
MDANAKVGSVPSSAIGTVAPDLENEAGAQLRRTMEAAGLCLPTTFSPCAEGVPSATWYSSADKGHRLDYVAVPASWLERAPKAFTPEHLDVTLERLGH